MMRSLLAWLFACIGIVFASMFALPVVAQTYPSKPIRFVVPLPQGRCTGSRRGGWCWGGDGARPPGLWHSVQRWLAVVTIAAASLFALPVVAQTYPSKPIRFVVPFPPGGNIDITARTIAPGLSEILGQQVIIDNRGGAGGIIGAELVAKSLPDGYNLVLGSSGTITIAPTLYAKAPYTLDSFTAVCPVANAPLVLEIHPSIPARTVQQFIALAKSRPDRRMTMASSGNGTTNHLAGELFQMDTGVRFSHIPYKGSGPALVELMAGQVELMFDQLSSSSPFLKAGKLRGLAVTSASRTPLFPELPTLAETGVKDYEASTFTGIMGPAGMPREIVDKLNAATMKVLAQSATRERFASIGSDVLGGSPDQFAAFLKRDYAKWSRVIKQANVKVE